MRRRLQTEQRVILKSQTPARFGRVPPRARRVFRGLFFLGAFVLLVNAFVGENGLVDSLAVRARHGEIVDEVERLRGENERLRELARRLREDPRAIEEVAREELGLIAPGEIVLYINDLSE